MGVARETFRQLTGLEDDLEYLQRVAGPRATTMTINRIRSRVKAALTNKIWADARYLPLDPGRRGPTTANGKQYKSGIQRKHVAKRIFTSRALGNKQYSDITGYTKPIPAISLAQSKQRGTGKIRVKGSTVQKKTTGKRAKVQKSTLYGVKIGGVTIPGGFINVVSRNLQPHIFKKRQFKTWMPGYVGWRFHDKSRGIRMKSPVGTRAPYDIVKFAISKSFNAHFESTVNETTEKYWAEEYDRALGVTAGRILAANSK